MTPEPEQLLRSMLARLPDDERTSLVLSPGETLVPATAIEQPGWLDEQLKLRGRRWATTDRRVLATLWWYSASAWVIGPTLTSMVLSDHVLSAEPEDLDIHWLPDSRITGATSTRLLSSATPVEAAGHTLRSHYDRVIPALADLVGMRPRPLWAIAADAVANRLLGLGRAVGEIERATALLDPLTDIIGDPLPRTHYTRLDDPIAMRTHRCSCCLLYLAPRQHMCDSCPRGGMLRRTRAVE